MNKGYYVADGNELITLLDSQRSLDIEIEAVKNKLTSLLTSLWLLVTSLWLLVTSSWFFIFVFCRRYIQPFIMPYKYSWITTRVIWPPPSIRWCCKIRVVWRIRNQYHNNNTNRLLWKETFCPPYSAKKKNGKPSLLFVYLKYDHLIITCMLYIVYILLFGFFDSSL